MSSPLLAKVKGNAISNEERATLAVEVAEELLDRAVTIRSRDEKQIQAELARMMNDSSGKVFTTYMADQCFRSSNKKRVADQLCFLIDSLGVPRYLSWDKRFGLHLFRLFGKRLPSAFVSLVTLLLRKEMSRVILPGEADKLGAHMRKRTSQGVRVNLNHLGEAILGEEEAERRTQIYEASLAKPEVDYVSIKVSTIFSQINLLAWEDTLKQVKERLRRLYRAATEEKFVNLDMEEYRDLHLTVDLFCQVLDEQEFQAQPAGIVLQAYLPDSFPIQKKLTSWAQKRVAAGGAPIKIRIVKGANLAMERVDASLHGWEQAPYQEKAEVDANFKRMLLFGFTPERAAAAQIGVGSHNLFDIAFALVLRSERGVEERVSFEMLEGMADHMRRALQEWTGDALLYCPAAKQHEFQNAVAYLIRRLDENTAKDNFLHDSFGMERGSQEWEQQKERFLAAVKNADRVSAEPRRKQDRNQPPHHLDPKAPFANEADTDWALPANRVWVEEVLAEAKEKQFATLPIVIAGQEQPTNQTAVGEDPSRPGVELYRYSLAEEKEVESALKTATQSVGSMSLADRVSLLKEVARKVREKRGELIGVMVADGGKTPPQADTEISEAVDFAEYYARSIEQHHALNDLEWTPKGVVVVTPPWNFPCAIPLGGVLAGLATGNAVIFKPARETVLVGWEVAKLVWEAGCSKELLQFITCEDDPVGSKLIQDKRVSTVILTGATDTAHLFQRIRPDLDLMAETGGKNALIATDMADRDEVIKDAVQSAFGHAGQKCSACSLLILEKGLYDDPLFKRQLRDAAASLRVGSAWDLATEVNPLITEPGEKLFRGLTHLDEGEEWLLEPKQHKDNPRLWSPGIRWGTKLGNFTQKNELFGPHLSVIRAESLGEAVEITNSTVYGLTSGIQTLDEREKAYWLNEIQAGNLYLNRGITGAIVQRQPFGGCKQSSFGRGSKAGGPNYLSQLMEVKEKQAPEEKTSPSDRVERLSPLISDEERTCWKESTESYAYWMTKEFGIDHDPSKIVGEDNILRYLPHDHVVLRVQPGDSDLDVYRVCAAAVTAGTFLEISCEDEDFPFIREEMHWTHFPDIQVIHETEETLRTRIEIGAIERLRFLSEPADELRQKVAGTPCRLTVAPVMRHGRIELLHYLREVSISHSYHRYGNLGEREE